jgi:branched-chain amino acid transport system permease protein
MSTASKTGLALLMALLLVLPRLVNPYVLQIVILTITYSMLGLAFALSLKVGLPRFDIAGWWAIGSYATAMLVIKTGMSFWLTIPIGGLIAVVLGLLVFSIIIPRGMMVFLLFGIVLTLGIQQTLASVKFFGSWGGPGVVKPAAIGAFVFVHKPAIYYMGLAFLALNVIAYRALFTSKIGRAWNAMGSSLKLADSIGISVVRYRIANVLIGNFFLALAGSYYVAYNQAVSPTTFSFPSTVYVMMYLVIGGLASNLAGPLIGALIVTFIPEYLRVAKEYEPIVTGVAIILIIIFMPKGIMGLLDERVMPWLKRTKWSGWFFAPKSRARPFA